MDLNLMMPGHPRYQPKSLVPYFGYDRIAYHYLRVEWALLETLGEIGFMSAAERGLLTPELRDHLFSSITTTMMDEREKKTRHDIRALVQLIREAVPESLRRWVHFGATSYDIINSATSLMFKEAYLKVMEPKAIELGTALHLQIQHYADLVQVGRTHGQHAIPVTVGFWLAGILGRICDILPRLRQHAHELTGKMSGPVGASNAVVALGIEDASFHGPLVDGVSEIPIPLNFEERVLCKLGLASPIISTQLTLPEALTRFLNELVLLSGALAQLGNDGRHLQRSEIAEIGEEFDAQDQVGSSAMPFKKNPINFENAVGMHQNVREEYGKALILLVSDHQRDLTGSSLMRFLPLIPILVQCQLEKLHGVVRKLVVDPAAIERNLELNSAVITGELAYMALQLAGYRGDAHEVIKQLTNKSQQEGRTLRDLLQAAAADGDDKGLTAAWNAIPPRVQELIRQPQAYIGKAPEICRQVNDRFKQVARNLC